MARVDQGKQGFTSIIREDPRREQEGNHVIDMEEAVASPSWFCCFGSGGGKIIINQQESNHLLQGDVDITNIGEHSKRESWFASKLKRLKEFSERVAGPRWKNFIRKIGRYLKPNNKPSKTQCMYSPNSYALNFDDGRRRAQEEEDDFFVSFSSRFSASAPPSSIDKQRPATDTAD